jgi:hypothetical protein
MNGRIRRHRRAGPKHRWIGPVLWVLAVAFLALTIVILVKTSPHKGAPKPPVAAAIILPMGWRRFTRSNLEGVTMHPLGPL